MTAEFIVALHTVEFLHHKGGYRTSEEIARNVCTNPARIRKIMHSLKAAGIARGQAGAQGGYTLCRPAEQLTLYELYRAVGESFVDVKWRSGDDCAQCPIARNMKPLTNELFDALELCAAQKLQAITLADVDGRIFPSASSAD